MCVLGCAYRYGRTPRGQNDCVMKSPRAVSWGVSNHVYVLRRYGRTPEGQDYWIVKNTWSPYWGIDGYIYIARDPDHDCGIATQAIYTDLRVV